MPEDPTALVPPLAPDPPAAPAGKLPGALVPVGDLTPVFAVTQPAGSNGDPTAMSPTMTAVADAGDKPSGPAGTSVVPAGSPTHTLVSVPDTVLPTVTPAAAVSPSATGSANAAPLSFVGAPSTAGGAPGDATAALPDGAAALFQVHATQPSLALPYAMLPGAIAASWGTTVPPSLTTVRPMSPGADSATAIAGGSKPASTPVLPRGHRAPGEGKSPAAPGSAGGTGSSASGGSGSAAPGATGALALLLFAAGMCWASWALLVATVRWRSLTLLLLLERPG